MVQIPREEALRTLARADGMIAVGIVEQMLVEAVTKVDSDAHLRLRGVKQALYALIEENDDLLEGYLKVAGEAAALEDKYDEAKKKHKSAERACAHMGAKNTALRNTLLDAVAAAAGRREY